MVKLNTVQVKLTLLNFILLLVLSGIVFYVFFENNIKRVKTNIEAEVNTNLSFISQDLVKITVLDSAAVASDLTYRLRYFHKINQLIIYSKNYQPLFYYSKQGFQANTKPNLNWDTFSKFTNANHISLRPLNHLGSHYGYIYSEVSAKEINDVYTYFKKQSIYLLLVLLFASLLLAISFEVLILSPLKKLVFKLKEVGKTGDFSRFIKVNRNDEIGQLFNQFNKVQSAIIDTNKALFSQKVALDKHSIVAITDIEGTITFVNEKFSKISGYKISELIGKNHRILNSGLHNKNFFKVLYRTIARGRVWQGEICNKTKKGHFYWVDTTIVPILDDESNKTTSYIAIRTDITQQKAYELALKKSNKRALVAVKAKSEFLASMSHEIRTPLNGVIGMLNFLLNTPLNEEQLNQVNIAKTSSKHLLTVISDILDFSKIEAGKLSLDIRPYNLKSSLDDCLAPLAILASQKSIILNKQLNFLDNDYFVADESRINQILFNVVSNAIKFTTKGTVTFKIEVLEDAENYQKIQFSTIDTGIGIKKEKIANLFGRFTQADSTTTRNFGGTGLGLAISQQLLLLMNAKLYVESEYGKGSCFSFILQLEKSQASAIPVSSLIDIRRFSLKPCKLLVVDDNVTNQLITEGILCDFGATVDVVENGRQAVEAVLSKQYDIIFMDCQMPIMDGYKATRAIRKNEIKSLKHNIIIALTANAMPEDREKCIDCGMNDYIAKPVEPEKISELLSKWLPEFCIIDDKKMLETVQKEPEVKNIIFDKEATIHRLMGDIDLVKTIVDTFVKDSTINLILLKELIEKNDLPKIAATAHKIKGASAVVGAIALSEVAFIIEKLAKEKQANTLNNHFSNLKNQFNLFKKTIVTELK